MHTIMMIGKMNELTKNINHYLRRFFTVQICNDDPKHAMGMIKVVNPELLLISLVGGGHNVPDILSGIEKSFPALPVFTIGTDSERLGMASYYKLEHCIHCSAF